MGSEAWPILGRATIPFLAGAAATAAVINGLYATATLGLLIALWSAAIARQTVARHATPPNPVPSPASRPDAEAHRRLSLYLDLSPAPLVALDAGDRLRAINRAARRLLAAEDIVQAPPTSLIEAIAATPPGRSATIRIDAGGGEHGFAVLTADIEAGTGAVRVAALVDIDADLKAAEAAGLRDLVDVLSHEITNTLTPIASLSATAATMLAEPGADIDAVRGAIETVARRAEGLQRFGAAYRAFARLPPPTKTRVDMNRLVADLAQLFATRWPDTAFQAKVMTLPPVEADGDQIAQAIWALLTNAAEVADTVTLDVDLRDGTIVIRVADDGPGVAPPDGEAIFRPFFTTKAEGSGVGLALARQILRGHGGDVRHVASHAGPTTFEALLPG